MSADKPPNVSCKYGAPMGRPAYNHTGGEPTACRLTRLRFVDGDYDEGGAYWGSPADVFWLRDENDTIQAFFRARDRACARRYAARKYPNITVRP